MIRFLLLSMRGGERASSIRPAVVSACTKFSYDCHMRCVVLPGAADGPVRSTVFALHGAWRRVGRCHAQSAHASPSFDHSNNPKGGRVPIVL